MFSLRVALRYLFSKKSHNAVNVISIVSMFGVGIATAAIVCVLSVFNGFTDLAIDRMSAFDPPLRIVPQKGKVIASADSLAGEIGRLQEVGFAVPTIKEQGLAMFNGAQMAVDMYGVPDGYDNVVDLSRIVIDGQTATPSSEIPVALLSVGVAMRLKAFPGTDGLIGMYVPKRLGKVNTANPMASFRSDSLFVGGVIRTDDKDIDTRAVYLPIERVRQLLEYDGGEATSIDVAPAEGVDAEVAAGEIEALLPAGLTVQDRFQQEAQSFRMIAIEKWITFVMLTFILVIASFNIITTLSMLIIEKKDNLLTLRALGATIPTVRRIFVWEGWLITLLGGVGGVVLGSVLVLAQQYGGFIKLSGDPAMLSVTVYPVRLETMDLIIVFALIAAIGAIVGALTARFAVRTRS